MVNVHLASMPVAKQPPSELQPSHLPTQPIQQATLSTVTIPNPTTPVSLHPAVVPKPVEATVSTNVHPMVLTTNGAHLQMPQQQPASVRVTTMQGASCATTMATAPTSATRHNSSIQSVKQPSPRAKKSKKQTTVTMATAASATTTNSSQGENTGRWTAEEHRLFLQGLEQHGKGWKKIASLIKSRTVVQIRTHAQKYFQKLAKARENGEGGDVPMEGRGSGVSSVNNSGVGSGGNGQSISSSKRRRQTTGTKRKAISSVVASAQRQGKRMTKARKSSSKSTQSTKEDHSIPSLPTIAPALAPHIYPMAQPVLGTSTTDAGQASASGTLNHTILSGSALEDSLFRFLTPATGDSSQLISSNNPAACNDASNVARQAGANPIQVPQDNTKLSNQQQIGGDVSPTGVADITAFPNFVWAGEPPAWYTTGADVDELLSEAEALNWLADTGDLNEDYQPPAQPVSNTGSEPSLLSICGEPDISEKQLPVQPLEQVTQMQAPEHFPEQVEHGPATFAANAEKTGLLALDADTTNEVVGDIPTSSSAMSIPPLPSLFENSNSIENDLNQLKRKNPSMILSSGSLFGNATEAVDGSEDVFPSLLDNQFDEQAFVTALLDQSADSSSNLLNQSS